MPSKGKRSRSKASSLAEERSRADKCASEEPAKKKGEEEEKEEEEEEEERAAPGGKESGEGGEGKEEGGKGEEEGGKGKEEGGERRKAREAELRGAIRGCTSDAALAEAARAQEVEIEHAVVLDSALSLDSDEVGRKERARRRAARSRSVRALTSASPLPIDVGPSTLLDMGGEVFLRLPTRSAAQARVSSFAEWVKQLDGALAAFDFPAADRLIRAALESRKCALSLSRVMCLAAEGHVLCSYHAVRAHLKLGHSTVLSGLTCQLMVVHLAWALLRVLQDQHAMRMRGHEVSEECFSHVRSKMASWFSPDDGGFPRELWPSLRTVLGSLTRRPLDGLPSAVWVTGLTPRAVTNGTDFFKPRPRLAQTANSFEAHTRECRDRVNQHLRATICDKSVGWDAFLKMSSAELIEDVSAASASAGEPPENAAAPGAAGAAGAGRAKDGH